jgi:hypothetical protein
VAGSRPIIATSYLTSTFQPELIDGFGEHFLKGRKIVAGMFPSTLHHLPTCATSTEQLPRRRYDRNKPDFQPYLRESSPLFTD